MWHLIDEELLSSISLQDLHLEKSDYITLKIAIKDDANNKGGATILVKEVRPDLKLYKPGLTFYFYIYYIKL